MRILYIFILTFFFNPAIGQQDTLNKFNDKGKRTGFWKIYFDENADPTDSLSNAYFYGYQLWDNGEEVWKYPKHTYYDSLTFDGIIPKKGQPELINGTFKYYNNKGLIVMEESYKNGQPVFFKAFLYLAKNPTDVLGTEFLDFTKKYNNTIGTYYYEEYNYDQRIKQMVLGRHGYYRKEKKKWKVQFIK